MDVSKNRWETLDVEIKRSREISDSAQVQNRLLAMLKDLARKKRCSENVQGWLCANRVKGRCVELAVKASSDAVDNRERPAIRLYNLHHLEDGAVLSLITLTSERAPKGIRSYSVGIQGVTKASKQPWYARVDLTEKPEGEGLCSHPLLHCHIGLTPEVDESASSDDSVGAQGGQPPEEGIGPKQKYRRFAPRVPLPWLLPWEALAWLLATVDPDLEP